jgi:Sulfotransferase domain
MAVKNRPAASAGGAAERRGDPGSVRLLYIGGSGRSGSTLLERLLGQLEGFCSVGEVVHLWRRGVVGNEQCGCGVSFAECGFWQDVGTLAFGGWKALDSRRVLSLERAVSRHRFIPLMITAPEWSLYGRRRASYRDLLRRLYRAIHRAAEGRIVVDSSKNVPHAFALSGTPDVHLHLLHIVRDSRGVAHSWTKRVVRPEVTGTTAYMPTYTPSRAAADWMVDNLLFRLVGSQGLPYHLVRYEDLVRRPRQVIHGILEFLGYRPAAEELNFLEPSHAVLGTTHSVAGNPMRFHHGRIRLASDEEWRLRMDVEDRLVVTAITWPLLARYGYGIAVR